MVLGLQESGWALRSISHDWMSGHWLACVLGVVIEYQVVGKRAEQLVAAGDLERFAAPRSGLDMRDWAQTCGLLLAMIH